MKTSFNSNKITSFGKEEIPTPLPLQIEIIDFGIGIPSNLLSSIFLEEIGATTREQNYLFSKKLCIETKQFFWATKKKASIKKIL